MNLFDATPYSNKKICVALSGGVDSVCLLHFFCSCIQKYNISLSAVHVEHGIRKEESLRDMRFCEELCKTWGVPLLVERRDVPAFAKACGLGLEEAARNVRYEIFHRILSDGKADLVATAHHANDLCETLLFRLARGTSPAGMNAILSGRGLARPFLKVPKAAILDYAAFNHLPHIEDSTNSDETITRNYIRLRALPAFEKIHDGAAEHLISFAEQCARDDEFLNGLAKKEITFLRGDRLVRADLPEPLFLRACLICLEAEKDYTSANLYEILKLKDLQSGKKVCLPAGQEAAREYGNIVFYRPAQPIPERPFTRNEYRTEPFEGALKADLSRFPKGCVVRGRKEGDFIIPFGGKKKSLKKFLTDKKISARLGKKLPLVACGAEVLAVLGVEISDKVKVDETTKQIIYL